MTETQIFELVIVGCLGAVVLTQLALGWMEKHKGVETHKEPAPRGWLDKMKAEAYEKRLNEIEWHLRSFELELKGVDDFVAFQAKVQQEFIEELKAMRKLVDKKPEGCDSAEFHTPSYAEEQLEWAKRKKES